MQEYVKRMIIEKEDLEGKIKKAKKAIENPPFGADTEGMNLLNTQVGFMEQYLDVLKRRIEHEEGK